VLATRNIINADIVLPIEDASRMRVKVTSSIVVLSVIISVFCFVLTVLPENVRATTLYVGGTGSGNYTSIQDAIDDAMPGYTIFVYDGIYTEQVVIDKTLNLIGESKGATIVDGNAIEDVVNASADWVNVTGFTLRNSGSGFTDAGIELYYAKNCQVDNITVLDTSLGVFLFHSDSNVVVDVRTRSNSDGINLLSANGNLLANIDASNNRDEGISAWYSEGNRFANITTAWNLGRGFSFFFSNGNVITGSNVSYEDYGIYLYGSSNGTVTGNTVFLTRRGSINLFGAHNSTLSDNRVVDNDYGIYIDGSRKNKIVDNLFSSNFLSGIDLILSDDNTLANNTFSSRRNGLALYNSKGTALSNNLFFENGISIFGSKVEHWNSHLIDTSNAVNDKPVYYWKNVTGGTVPSGAGQVILANCSGVAVENQYVSNGDVGINLGFSSNNNIVDNTLSMNEQYGIRLDDSNDNSIARNTALANGWSIYLSDSNNNTVSNSTASSSGRGIGLSSSKNNTISNNTVSDNFDGIRFVSSTGNWIFHNNILDSERWQAYESSGSNQWDNGYPSGGNYWNDYAGTDQFSGSNQDQPGSDGKGDTPYPILIAAEDRYPLMSPFGIVRSRPPTMLQATLSGNKWENVTLAWSLSLDDERGFKSVVGYEVFRGTTYDTDGLGYGLVASLPNGTLEFVDALAGEGNPNNYFYRVCALDLNSNATCAEHQAGKFTRPILAGTDLISIPLIQSDETIETVLQTVAFDKAWTYDSLSGEWESYMTFKPYMGDFQTINHTMGVWVHVISDCNLTVAGVVPRNTSIAFTAGWNLVGFPSFNSTYIVSDLKVAVNSDRVEVFDLSSAPYHLRLPADTEALQAGYGYWVRIGKGTVWKVDV
jgi:parallel beta-helix repeat protein